MSQLDLALEAEISTRHLSFVETGRAQPSREMLLHLAQALDIPLRERNAMLVAAGFAPRFEARAFDAPDMAVAREAVQRVLDGHEPYPALAVDRHWTLLAANRAVMPLLAGVDPSLLSGAVNVLRLSLHPDGLAPRIANLPEWRAHLLHRLRQQIHASGDATLGELYEELKAYPVSSREPPPAVPASASIFVPMQLRTDAGLLSFFSTTTVSARRWMSRSPNWRSKRSIRPMRQPAGPCAPWCCDAETSSAEITVEPHHAIAEGEHREQ